MGGTKDADMSPFESGRRLLDPASKQLTLDDRLNLVFQDADLVPLLVQASAALPSQDVLEGFLRGNILIR